MYRALLFLPINKKLWRETEFRSCGADCPKKIEDRAINLLKCHLASLKSFFDRTPESTLLVSVALLVCRLRDRVIDHLFYAFIASCLSGHEIWPGILILNDKKYKILFNYCSISHITDFLNIYYIYIYYSLYSYMHNIVYIIFEKSYNYNRRVKIQQNT